MRICIDTNLLVRLAIPVADGSEDGRQAEIAARIVREATAVVVSTPVLCEFCWVLDRVYKFSAQEIAGALRSLLRVRVMEVDRRCASLGLEVLEAGGDFADGAVAAAGAQAGARRFVSFDRRAVARLAALGHDAIVPA